MLTIGLEMWFRRMARVEKDNRGKEQYGGWNGKKETRWRSR